jgi:hypothetical protein
MQGLNNPTGIKSLEPYQSPFVTNPYRFVVVGGGGTRGLFGGGWTTNVIAYITISTTGDATDFGDLTIARGGVAGCADSTRGCFGGGSGRTDLIDYITISTTGNATDFGDLSPTKEGLAGLDDS